MFRRSILAAIVIWVGASSLAPVLAQSNYTIPRAVKVDSIVRRNFRSFFVRLYPGGPMQLLYAEGFYPIGWSRDGKFAYYVEPVDEECGCYFAELHIVDLRTDKDLWKFENRPEERMDEKGKMLEDNMQKLWARNKKMFSDKLREHGIEQTARFSLLPTTFRSAGKTYTTRVTASRSNDPDGLRRVRKLSLDLSSPTLGNKSLYAAEYKGNEIYGSPLDVAVAGAFKSPYENRVAVVLLKVQRGWEGPPHTVDIQIAGADLDRGFRKF